MGQYLDVHDSVFGMNIPTLGSPKFQSFLGMGQSKRLIAKNLKKSEVGGGTPPTNQYGPHYHHNYLMWWIYSKDTNPGYNFMMGSFGIS
jgi:hypothetical protein